MRRRDLMLSHCMHFLISPIPLSFLRNGHLTDEIGLQLTTKQQEFLSVLMTKTAFVKPNSAVPVVKALTDLDAVLDVSLLFPPPVSGVPNDITWEFFAQKSTFNTINIVSSKASEAQRARTRCRLGL